ncbi:Putative metal-sulfur cluster biosynthetic enzyme [Corynebacterium camporealensis]|uniref:Putative metal-sulfur cluster biosynthetic enzyme n=1 Tax=Corynebacterium camporealensis TaxID=161896 RepID=A0A0F6TB66_9CORY|nr:metal-sulfur cluster assembly factor [Corynebacterium camporealensis]AKE39201.1 putative metal-sulfur cluster biosynthetic enzyme [Corynebacterium camporealensis]AVH88400.1 Putative metal-sulfur cluster biosynthetic enzyme [Corynebacterium camporealensis]MDY5840327.1 metal-sulfur cluster assembly factor [Corynebacterium camporealensis]
MSEPQDPYQNENSNFDGQKTRPEQTEEQISKAYDVTEFMRDVIDPELGINVVDLGLVYDVWIEEQDGKQVAEVNMTLTSPACPLTDVIAEQIDDAVVGNKVCDAVNVNWVWMPPWGPHMITEEGREQLQALGFAV